MRKKEAKAKIQGDLNFRERFSYSLGSLASNLVWTAISAFIVIFYTDVAVIPAATVGLLILISRIFDGASDIGMGILIDRTHSPKGKARVWLLRMAIPYGVAVTLCFTVPDWALAWRIVYAFITYNLMTTIVYTSVDIPYGVMNATLSKNQYERSVLNIFRLFMAVIAGVTVNVAVPILVEIFGGGAKAWQLTFVILGGISSILFLLTYAGTKERVLPETQKKDNVTLLVGLKALFHNKYWGIIVIYAILTYTASGLSGATAYFCREILGDFKLVGTLTLFGIIPMIIGSFVLAPIVKRIGKRNAALIGVFTSIAGCLIMLADSTNLGIIFVSIAMKSFGSACVIGTLFAMIADTIEYGQWKTGIRIEGLTYSASSFGNKLGNGIGTAILGITLSLGGYVARETVGNGPTGQSASTLLGIRFLFIGMPLILLSIMVVLLLLYRLDQEYASIIAALENKPTTQLEGGGEER